MNHKPCFYNTDIVQRKDGINNNDEHSYYWSIVSGSLRCFLCYQVTIEMFFSVDLAINLFYILLNCMYMIRKLSWYYVSSKQ